MGMKLIAKLRCIDHLGNKSVIHLRLDRPEIPNPTDGTVVGELRILLEDYDGLRDLMTLRLPGIADIVDIYPIEHF